MTFSVAAKGELQGGDAAVLTAPMAERTAAITYLRDSRVRS